MSNLRLYWLRIKDLAITQFAYQAPCNCLPLKSFRIKLTFNLLSQTGMRRPSRSTWLTKGWLRIWSTTCCRPSPEARTACRALKAWRNARNSLWVSVAMATPRSSGPCMEVGNCLSASVGKFADVFYAVQTVNVTNRTMNILDCVYFIRSICNYFERISVSLFAKVLWSFTHLTC